MADRFVSAGTAEDPPERDDEWLAAQRELDENARRKKEEATSAGSGLQEGGKTLFEVLQANKAAKQEAFEESAKLKHQFRSLDEDEIDFLDSVLESTRKKEDEVRKETSEQLEAFRKQREEAERKAREGDDATHDNAGDVSSEWQSSGRKRKKKDNGPIRGLKLRKTSSVEAPPAKDELSTSASHEAIPPSRLQPENHESGTEAKGVRARTENKPTSPAVSKTPVSSGLGLGAYSSDED